MTVTIFAALGIGLGLTGMITGLREQRTSISQVLEALNREIQPPVKHIPVPQRMTRPDLVMAERLKGSIDSRPTLRARLSPALALSGSSLEGLCSQVVLSALVGVLLPFVCWGIIQTGGLQVSPVVPVMGSLLCTVAGVSLPFLVLSSEVKRRRRDARRVVGTFLDLVVLCLAGGMGIEGALHSAAGIGDDDVSRRIAAALLLARDAGETPWEAMANVGAELGLDDLEELAAAVGLAGTQGARIRSTLAAKAASVRRRELADAEAEANTVTERLFLPGVLMLIGFMLFIGYPAFSRIASGL